MKVLRILNRTHKCNWCEWMSLILLKPGVKTNWDVEVREATTPTLYLTYHLTLQMQSSTQEKPRDCTNWDGDVKGAVTPNLSTLQPVWICLSYPNIHTYENPHCKKVKKATTEKQSLTYLTTQMKPVYETFSISIWWTKTQDKPNEISQMQPCNVKIPSKCSWCVNACLMS